jgi:NAD(P)H dehydrogenase (quinone)
MRYLLSSISKLLNNFSSYIQPISDGVRVTRKVLLIRAHPVPESFSAALANATEKGLRSAGHEVRVKSLYHHADESLTCYAGATFPPSLTTDERRGYQNPALIKDRSAGILNLSPEVVEAISDLKWCDSVVFVFPTWWFSLPATLKGYFDRVLLPGVAFIFPDAALNGAGGTGLVSKFTNIKKMGVVTTYGAPYYVVLYCNDSSRSIIANGVRPICSPMCPLIWHGLYHMDSKTQQQREQFLARVEKSYSEF